MNKKFIAAGALLAAIAVALGAFGAHGLKKIVTPEQLDVFKTGVQYQFYHALGIIIAAIIGQQIEHNLIKRAAWLFFFGIIAFSGSLYAMTLFNALNTEGVKWIGAITPVGGLLFILGWIILGLGISKNQN